MIRRILSATLMSLAMALFALAGLAQVAVADAVTDPTDPTQKPIAPAPAPPQLACTFANLVGPPPAPGQPGPVIRACGGNLCPNGKPGICQILPGLIIVVNGIPFTQVLCDCPPPPPAPVPPAPIPPQPVSPIIVAE